ncbi:unnamed protein product [Gadus morhua 'NCC']
MFWLTLILVLLHLTRGNSPCFGRSLGISPSRTQFFKRESFTLYCGADERIMTNSKSVTCSQKIHECNITLAGEHHSGSYWCDSNSGERGEAVNITVTAGSVILGSPVHPVPEGSPVTLRCLTSHKSSKQLVVVTRINQSCTFSRDGRLFGGACWLSEQPPSPNPPPPPPITTCSSHFVYAGPPLLLMVLLGVVGGCCWRRSRKEAEEAASEDEVHADLVQNKTKKKERDRSDCESTCSYGESLQPQPIRIPDPPLYSLLG